MSLTSLDPIIMRGSSDDFTFCTVLSNSICKRVKDLPFYPHSVSYTVCVGCCVPIG